jgi:putative heme-binding domain-containing protein
MFPALPQRWIFAFTASLLAATTPLATAQPPADEFALGVRTTEPVSATEQLKSFTLPPGFSIQLVAAEPQLAKPMNLACDARGRLWVSSSEEYPFAAPIGSPAKDTIRILEDTNGDFTADSSTVFADGLNIPIGLIPWQDGVICFSIPNIWFLRDTDGDNRCDERQMLYGPFDTTRDTHGMCNAFRMGDDGWIYACHGFNNRSEVAGKDGHKVVLTSGNTFRFRPDGSRIELYTQGQVNPFGMAIDRLGDIYTADCHTKPVTLLLPGGCYDSFGRPHDGLGYVPNVMEHLHGSTAIAALALGEHTGFPAEYQNSTFDGNVITSRVNRNQLQRRGSSVKAIEQPDFLASTDPWFRPVDIVAGPDGALYIADFYNRIIGHYEVDLKHPGRDRHRGRIWRVSWQPADETRQRESGSYGPNLSSLSTAELFTVISTGPAPAARLAFQQLSETWSAETAQLTQQRLTDTHASVRTAALRLLATHNSLPATALQDLAADPDEQVRIHVQRVLRESPAGELPDGLATGLLLHAFKDDSPLVRRAAAAAASRHPSSELLQPLLRLLQTTELGDVHLRHATRIALRDHLLHDAWLPAFAQSLQNRSDIAAVADLCLAVRTAPAARFVAEHLDVVTQLQPQRLPEALQFAAAHVSPDAAANVVQTIRNGYSGRLQEQGQLLNAMADGFSRRGETIPVAVRRWALELSLELLGMSTPDDLAALHAPAGLRWEYAPHSTAPNPGNCWGTTQSRRCADGQTDAVLYSSFEAGEKRTGIWRSAIFPAPAKLSFFIAGHDGFPDQPLKQSSFVQLLHAQTKAILKSSPPPRNDTAQLFTWDLQELAGQPVQLQLVDGNSESAYAWLAAGRFSEERLNPSDVSGNRLMALQLTTKFRLQELEQALLQLLRSDSRTPSATAPAAAAIASLRGDSRLAALALVPGFPGTPADLSENVVTVFLESGSSVPDAVLEQAFRSAIATEQAQLAEQLATDAPGAEVLANLMENGKASARLLTRPSIQQRLLAIATEPVKKRLTGLLKQLPDESAETEKLIAERLAAVQQAPGNPDNGRLLFQKNCQICHQLRGEGKQVGPNLDGVAGRGLQRLMEDVLAPSRNVDAAFRTTTLVTKDGRAFSGLAKDLPDGQISLTDTQAKETILAVVEIEERTQSPASPMPANFGEVLTAEQLRDLSAWLMKKE